MPGMNLTRTEAESRRAVIKSQPAYDIELDFLRGEEVFGSKTTIKFDAVEGEKTHVDLIAGKINKIVFNGVELESGQVYRDSRIELENLKEHNILLVEADCIYSHTGEGLHRSVDPADGKVYLYSQFEVADSRRVFAVFEQPDIKAFYDFSVIAPRDWTIISTQPVKEEIAVSSSASSAKKTVFERTCVMSSYLTSIIAGPFAAWKTEYANEDGRTVPMGLYCRESLRDALEKDAEYLFDITKRGFAFYAKAWDLPYPYAKYDQIFVPEFNAGAMENIGAVTIRDSYVFESKPSEALRERRDITVLHELAHMWFGDYVTMKWWNDLWLNESFAEFMSTLCTAEATQWDTAWATFNSGEKSWGQRVDQLSTTHPITAPINDLNDTYVNFDGITYAKGASVLKQIVAYVGRKEFFDGIHNYLKKYAYSNACLADLLSELQASSGRDLSQWSKLWLEQSGVNTILAKVETDENGTISDMTLSQTAELMPGQSEPVLRAHRIAVGFYNESDGKIVRTDRFETDIDGEKTQIAQATGKKRADFILVNDDDLTYSKLRFDEQSRSFAEENLYRFDDALARSVIWLSFWDMVRDAQYPAAKFIEMSLKALPTEKNSTTLRYALGQISTAAHYYLPEVDREETLCSIAQRIFELLKDAPAGSDSQFQLLSSYLSYGNDPDFQKNAKGLLDGPLTFEGLEIDNNLRWSIVAALARAGYMTEADIDAQLALRDTKENRENAMGAKAAIPTAESKEKAWEQALHDENLTNSQLEAVAGGFSDNADPKLYEKYVNKYFETANWIWKNKTFHMAEALLCPLSGRCLYPRFADPEALAAAGRKWLEDNADADRALRGMISENTENSQRVSKVRKYNESL